ncbi:MAG: 4a-hydroxytetrahydrobiopterin dehydratase [Planctomycetaceae bacterium]|nr:4a-hydroxytetrahydrobiopterin dehydratase [Planctomycetaceae bacterium]
MSNVGELRSRRCVPCEGGIPRLTPAEAAAYLESLPGWMLLPNGERIRKAWTLKNFRAGMAFLHRVAAVAEEEGHHPDLHLTGYRDVAIEIWTHAIGGLSENDFILAAKIDALPIELSTKAA